MRALKLEDGKLQMQSEYADPIAPTGSSIVRVSQAGICETDLQLVAGYMGFEGVLGHEFVGVAESGRFAGQRVVGEINCVCGDCHMCSRGIRNHCVQRTVIGILNHDGAFADALVVPEANLHPVPDKMSDDLATLVEPIAAALQIPEQVSIKPNMRSVVVGDGRLGNLCAQVLRNAGCQVLVVGKHETKLQKFQAMGIETCLLSDAPNDRSADVVVDCAGSSSGLSTAVSHVRPRGTIVMKTTVAAEHQLTLASIVIDEITLIGSRCGPFDKAIKAINNGEFQLDGFIDGRYPLEQFQQAFAHATNGDALKVILAIRL